MFTKFTVLINFWSIINIYFIIKPDILGKVIKDEHSENIPLIFLTLVKFHCEISGRDIKEEHLENKNPISITF